MTLSRELPALRHPALATPSMAPVHRTAQARRCYHWPLAFVLASCINVAACQQRDPDPQTSTATVDQPSGAVDQVSERLIDRCLISDTVPDLISPIEFFRIEGKIQTDDARVPGYQIFSPADSKGEFGYAVSKNGSDDYIFVRLHRGDAMRAKGVGGSAPARIGQPAQATYAIMREKEQEYACVVADQGHDPEDFTRMAWVAKLPVSKEAPLILFYKTADIATFKGFKDPNKAGVPTSITGIDHLADHLSVQEFFVNGRNAFQAGKGGSQICCATLPRRWQPGMTVKVSWNITNWRDCKGEEREAVVPVEKYDEPERLWIHFLANGKVRAVSSFDGAATANSPDSQHPVKDPIPDKYPWSDYPPRTHCKHSFE